MAEATQFIYSLEEVAKLLVKDQKLTTGKWVIGFEFGIMVGNFGADQSADGNIHPGTMVTIQKVTLAIAPDDIPNEMHPRYLVDATKISE
jgi:phosphohistidine swiveling domain-containing protein